MVADVLGLRKLCAPLLIHREAVDGGIVDTGLDALLVQVVADGIALLTGFCSEHRGKI